MGITEQQRQKAEAQQQAAAKDSTAAVRVVAGPGTGKSHTIELRVAHVLSSGANPANVYVISFTRATVRELRERIVRHCSAVDLGEKASAVRVSTMHSLALSILKHTNLLHNLYPDEPTILDNWEQKNIYDPELASKVPCTPGRAGQIREAHDSYWETLDPDEIAQQEVTPEERQRFETFNASTTNLYACVLPGEVIFKCVSALDSGHISVSQLPKIEHLVVDEFQDLNYCDQRFVWYLSQAGAKLFVAGDDDQSIYSFRHANFEGIMKFDSTYEGSASHALTDCFRCTPSILTAAKKLILYNEGRLPKSLDALYGAAEPPVQGTIRDWQFPTGQQEAAALADSCKTLIDCGFKDQEDEILILLARRNPPAVQLDPITEALSKRGVEYTVPVDPAGEGYEIIRAVYTIIRIVRDRASESPDYPAHRALLGLLAGIGIKTARDVADECITHGQNFRGLFYLPSVPKWLTGKAKSGVERVRAVIEATADWSPKDTISEHRKQLFDVLSSNVFKSHCKSSDLIAILTALLSGFPDDMTLDELFNFLAADTDAGQALVLHAVRERLLVDQPAAAQKKVRILTMHGRKGAEREGRVHPERGAGRHSERSVNQGHRFAE
jgi:DNA helicase II / ATP-dependent DNA helicase PcrA